MNCEIDIKNAVETLRRGGVILYPTDTVWGIGCDATCEEAVRRIYEIKRRSESKAMICLVDKPDRIQRYFRSVPDVAWDLLDTATSPLTLILDGAEGVAPNLIASDGSLGVRVTRDQFSHDICYRLGRLCVFVQTGRQRGTTTEPYRQARSRLSSESIEIRQSNFPKRER